MGPKETSQSHSQEKKDKIRARNQLKKTVMSVITSITKFMKTQIC